MKPTALGILRSDVSFDCNSRLHCTSKVSFGSDSEVVASPSYVRFTLRSGGKADMPISTLWADSVAKLESCWPTNFSRK